MRAWWSRFWSKPPGAVLVALTVVICVLALWACSWPTPNGWILLLAVFWPAVAVGVCWLARTVVYLARTDRFRLRLLSVPMVAAVSMGLIVLNVPLQARWQVSAGAFDDGIAYLPHGEPATPDPVGEGIRIGHVRGDWYWFSAGW